MNRFGITRVKMRPKTLKRKTVIRMNEVSSQYFRQLTDDSVDLWNKVEELSDRYFGDMLFKPGSITYKYIEEEGQSGTSRPDLPEELEFFSYDRYDFKVQSLPEYVSGYYDNTDGRQEFCVNVTHKDDDDTILHELIHLHEDALSSLPYYRDVVFISLYWDLKRMVPDLDTVIRRFPTVLNETGSSDQSGEHSILFLLKSLDIDIRKGQKLGTVFGYDLSLKHGQDQD